MLKNIYIYIGINIVQIYFGIWRFENKTQQIYILTKVEYFAFKFTGDICIYTSKYSYKKCPLGKLSLKTPIPNLFNNATVVVLKHLQHYPSQFNLYFLLSFMYPCFSNTKTTNTEHASLF